MAALRKRKQRRLQRERRGDSDGATSDSQKKEAAAFECIMDVFVMSRKPINVANKSLFPTSKSCMLEVYMSLQRNLASYQDNRIKSSKEDYFNMCRTPVVLFKNKCTAMFFVENKDWIVRCAREVLRENKKKPLVDYFLQQTVHSFLIQAYGMNMGLEELVAMSTTTAADSSCLGNGRKHHPDVLFPQGPAMGMEEARRSHVRHIIKMEARLPFGEKASSFSLAGSSKKSGSNISHIMTNKRPRTGLRQKFSGSTSKVGKMRKTVCGKRQNQSARSVITPDTSISPDELGVPVHIAMTLTFPETVFSFNHHRLLNILRRGPNSHPGANFLRRSATDKMISLEHISQHEISGMELHSGDTLYRHLVDGDLVIFNRQPSLHRHSMMSHKVKIVAGKAYRVHMAVTKPYNADFDGDEMVMQVVLSEKGRAEARGIMAVGQNIMKDGAPIVSFQQHSVAGAFLLSKTPRIFTRGEAQQMLYSSGADASVARNKQGSWTGKDLISALLPQNMWAFWKCKDVGGEDVLVQDGKLISGHLNKHVLNNVILMAIWKDFGSEAAFSFLSVGYRLFEHAVEKFGLTVGLDDCFFPRSAKEKSLLQKALDFVDGFGDHHPLASGKKAEKIEHKISIVMDKTRDMLGSFTMAKMLPGQGQGPRGNKLKEIIDSGAKGNMTNIVQIASVVGQQCGSRSSRISSTVNHFKRMSGSKRAEAHGMIKTSFFQGLSSTAQFFHLNGAREGLVDTAVKTSETGYSQRKMACAMMDEVLQADGSVVDLSGSIVQFLYGNDGFASDSIERVPLGLLHLQDQSRFEAVYKITRPELLGSSQCKKEFELLHAAELENLRLLRQRLLGGMVGLPLSPTALSPVNFDRILLRDFSPQQLEGEEAASVPDLLSPLDIIRATNKLWRDKSWGHGRARTVESLFYSSPKFEALYRDKLATKRLWCEAGIRTKKQMNRLLETVVGQVVKHLAQAGESVGMKASQNCSEPFTQLTLNRFHKSGQFSQLVSGVARAKEIINAVKNPKTPSMVICLSPPSRDDTLCQILGNKEECEYLRAEELGAELVCVTGGMVADTFDVGFEADASCSRKEALLEMVNVWKMWSGEENRRKLLDPSKYMLFFVFFDRDRLSKHRCSPDQVCRAIKKSAFAKKIPNFEKHVYFHQGSPAAVSSARQGPSNSNENKPWACLVLEKKKIDSLYQKILAPLKKIRFVSPFDQGGGGDFQESAGSPQPAEARPETETADRNKEEDRAVGNQIFQKIICTLHLKGVPGIEDFFVDKVDMVLPAQENGTAFQEVQKNVIVTSGSNLSTILQIPQVDSSLTITNNIREIKETLGIDAAKKAIEEFWSGVMKNNDAHVGARHIQLISNTMCSKGRVHAMTYNGICGGTASIVKQASFEKAQDSFLRGAARGQLDNVRTSMDAICWNSEVRAGVDLSQTHSSKFHANRPDARVNDHNYRELVKRPATYPPIPVRELAQILDPPGCKYGPEEEAGNSKTKKKVRESNLYGGGRCVTSRSTPLSNSFSKRRTSATIGRRDGTCSGVPSITVKLPTIDIIDNAHKFKRQRRQYLLEQRSKKKNSEKLFPIFKKNASTPPDTPSSQGGSGDATVDNQLPQRNYRFNSPVYVPS